MMNETKLIKIMDELGYEKKIEIIWDMRFVFWCKRRPVSTPFMQQIEDKELKKIVEVVRMCN